MGTLKTRTNIQKIFIYFLMISLLTTVLLMVVLNINYQHKLYFTYEQKFKGFYYLATGRFQKQYSKTFNESVIKKHGNSKLISVFHLFNPEVYHVVFHIGGRGTLLKSALNITKTDKIIDDQHLYELFLAQVDIEIFNNYINEFNIIQKEMIMREFCNLLVDGYTVNSSLILETEEDFVKLFIENYHPLKDKVDSIIYSGKHFLDLSFKEKIRLKDENTVFLWIGDSSILRLHFTFLTSNRIENVDIQIEGYLFDHIKI
jgi:hypothetical protein